MKHQDKHKHPLSSEELFQWLDHPSNSEMNFDDMDDFEKEALEGYTSLANSEKAKTLVEEVNASISKKVTEQKGGQKHKIVWFSAAASIVLVVMISIFFFNKAKQSSDSNLAINENKETVTEGQKLQEFINPSNSDSKEIESDKVEKLEEVINSKNVLSESETKNNSSSASTLSQNKSMTPVARLTDESKDYFKNRKEESLDELNAQSIAIDKKAELKQKEKISSNNDKIEIDKASVVLESKSLSNGNSVSQVEYTSKVDGDYKVTKNEESQNGTKEIAASEKMTLTTVNKASAPATSINKEQSNITSYSGGESAIKEYVLNYLKEHSQNSSMKGKYEVLGKVNAKGELKVDTITQISKEYCEGCSDKIKEALNTMKNWNASSVAEFTLNF